MRLRCKATGGDLESASFSPSETALAEVQRITEAAGHTLTEAELDQVRAEMDPPQLWQNKIYTVSVFFDGPVTHLSIKRNDRESVHDWRDLQELKNAICGPEREAVEIYPAESRRVDMRNQYHLWVLPAG